MTSTDQQLPSTMKAIVLHGPGQSSVDTVPTPHPNPGSITIKVLHAMIHNNAKNIIKGSAAAGGFQFQQPYPHIPGGYGVGRVAAPGPDTTMPEFRRPGQLVIFDPFVRARDDGDVAILHGAFDGIDERTKKFTRDNWRDGCWAEYVRMPLENTWAVDENRLLGQLALKTEDLVFFGPLAVAYGGLRKINLTAGETIVVTPATGLFSGAVVAVARAMGATVIAVSRNAEKLAELENNHPGLKTIVAGKTENLTEAIAAHGSIDVVVDFSPPSATDSEYLGQAIGALRRYGRVCLMGGRGDATLPVPHAMMVFKDLTVRGSWMYERDHVRTLVKMVETGVLKLGKAAGLEVIASYPLEKMDGALDKGAEVGASKMVVLGPQ
ncbi:isopropanol dehydrogenase [Pochonia chlamydosporia 170]|uniref:Isopropanol dehydrogenase n=1 Tax=Pochonia chlamydosporia 170 TaxID=1380566 RepID=A0A179G6Q8_METCM|nr:isopropanol dehydrogenase [Pochonia chlamydosporia 170]OAQ73482.1 isopropanol dehydrogenase [Pochonia chlamydosporia 170]